MIIRCVCASARVFDCHEFTEGGVVKKRSQQSKRLERAVEILSRRVLELEAALELLTPQEFGKGDIERLFPRTGWKVIRDLAVARGICERERFGPGRRVVLTREEVKELLAALKGAPLSGGIVKKPRAG